jgi:hypothetical protein
MLLDENFVMQGGVRNYLGETEEVIAPKFWQSSKDSPPTELAYITEAEKGLLLDANLHGSLQNNKPNMGASGLLSFDGWGDVTSSGSTDTSAGNAGAEGGQGSGGGGYDSRNYNDNPNDFGGDQEDDVAQMETSMGVTTPNTPTGWSGDSGVDAYESNINDSLLGTPDYQGTIFTGGTYATDDNQGSRTLSYGDDAATEDLGRPDITYYQPTGTTRGNSKSKYELNQIKYIQDQKLKTVKNKLRKAGFEISKDANFAETKAFINDLSSDELPDSYRDLKKADGTPFYSQETLDEWEKDGYIPTSGQHDLPGVLGGFLSASDKPLTRDELWASLDEATEVGKSGGGAMDWQERMKTYSPMQYANMTGMDYNKRTKTFTKRPGGSNEQDAYDRVVKPYEIGGTTPQESMVNQYFSNMGSNLGVSSAYMDTYNAAKDKISKTLNLTQNTQQYGYGNTFNDNYARSMTSANPFFDELTNQGLI